MMAWDILTWLVVHGGSVDLNEHESELTDLGGWQALAEMVDLGWICRDNERAWIRPSIMIALLAGGSA